MIYFISIGNFAAETLHNYFTLTVLSLFTTMTHYSVTIIPVLVMQQTCIVNV